MKLFNSMGPNPHIVRMYAAELGVAFDEVEEIDLMAGDNRKPGYPAAQPCGPATGSDAGQWRDHCRDYRYLRIPR